MLRAVAFTKRLAGCDVLRDVALECLPGKAIALVGPNGAGKTVLLKSLSLVDPPDQGSIEIDNIAFKFPGGDGQPSAIWPSLTMLFQQLFLWPHLTILENVLLPSRLRDKDRSLQSRTMLLLQNLQIENVAHRYPNQVSGGQQQRAALARALLLEPKWLLLDEPNSALDVEQNELLIKILKRLKMKGTGIIFSNHLLGFAAAIADEVYFLDDGHVVEKGGTSILALPSTARMSRFLGMFEHRSSRSENGA